MNNCFSKKLQHVAPSESIDMAQKVMSISKEKYIINLTWGQPDFDTPEHVKNAATESIRSHKMSYTHSAGIFELREAIAEYYWQADSKNCTPDNILVVPGAKQGLMYLMQTLLDPGDEVILFEPYWLSYRDMISLNGGVAKSIPAGMAMMPDVAKVPNRITSRTKALLINNPVNPSGYVFTKKELAYLAEVADKHNILIISDEIYDRLSFKPFVSLASFDGIQDKAIIVNGFSKSFAMTGWRIGYLLAPPEIIKQVGVIHQHTATCAAAPSQYAALAAITGPQDSVDDMRNAYLKRRDIFVNGLSQSRFEPIKPDGTFYCMLHVPDIPEQYPDPSTFLLEEYNIATINGSSYGDSVREYVRLSLCCDEETLEKAVSSLNN